MKMFKRIKEWYKKPRKGLLFETSIYILNEPHAFNVLLMMGMVSGTIMFSFLTLIFFMGEMYILTGLFGTFTLAILYKLYTLYKLGKVSGGITKIFGDRTVNDFVYKK